MWFWLTYVGVQLPETYFVPELSSNRDRKTTSLTIALSAYPLLYSFAAILAQLSLSVTVRLKTGLFVL